MLITIIDTPNSSINILLFISIWTLMVTTIIANIEKKNKLHQS